MAFTLVVPPGTVDLATIDPVVISGGTDPGTWYFYEGSQTITAGADLSARAEQASVYIGKDTNLTFQQVFKLGTSGTFRTDAVGGLLNIMASDSGDDTIAKFISTGGMKVIDAGGGTWTDVEIGGGEVTIAAGTVLTNWYQSGGIHTINSSSTGLTSLRVSGGTLYCRRKMADDQKVFVDGGTVYFRSAQKTATSTITISGSDGELHISGRGKVVWEGGAIDRVYLDSEDAQFHWQDMPAAATIALVSGPRKAIDRSGLREGATNTLRNGAILTVTSLDAKVGKAGQDAGGMLSPN